MLGLLSAFAALTLSFWIGAIIGLALLFVSSKNTSMKTELPFAPFLILGALIVFLSNIDIFSLVRIFQL
jgi:prepilin signal peptidase PulO-like enzyme (type II secretory pathway)